jgi:ABC-type Na+ transport system ATPase subunit NatA
MVDPIIRFNDVSKTFRRPDGAGEFLAVDRLSFAIAPGEIVTVLGKTGCVGWAKARLRAVPTSSIPDEPKMWARFALPTLPAAPKFTPPA